jgi:hypothetical protein
VTELVQHRALLGENQQQRKNQRKAKSESFHGLARYSPAEIITTREVKTLRSLHPTVFSAITQLRRSPPAQQRQPSHWRGLRPRTRSPYALTPPVTPFTISIYHSPYGI